MYFGDHHPPHFHAHYAEHEALIVIEDGAVLRGSLPRTALSLVQRWLELHREDLLANWQLAQIPQPLVQIEPLR